MSNNHDDSVWKDKLSPEKYRITRQHGTERAFTGKFHNHKAEGTYTCTCCGEPLFDSTSKFDSGCGWPSFFVPKDDNNIDEVQDTSFGMIRTEILCSSCGAHLGHVFNDGPQPTGLRYCVNSASLNFVDPNGNVEEG